MRHGEFFTWARTVNIGIVDEVIPSDEMRKRTLGITYTDRVRNFDHIEWELDNRDGVLTRPETIAAGLVVRLQLGYSDGTFPWKAFIINRVQGGLGVFGRENASIGDGESKVTFYGRNRNAVGGRASRSFGKRARGPTKKPPKIYKPTTDITSHEMVLGTLDEPRVIHAETTSDAVAEIARRNGFQGSYALIEPVDDTLEGGALTIPPGTSDAQMLQILADRYDDFIFKIDNDGLHWHSVHWPGAKFEVVDELIYGSTPDILNISMDCDFRLPTPGRTTAKGYSYRKGTILAGTSDYDEAKGQVNMAFALTDMLKDPARFAALTRHEEFPAVLDSLPQAKKRMLRRFTNRYIRAFKVSMETVGNPRLTAGKLIRVGGTGSPFVDRKLYITEAQHIVTGNDYKCRLTLTSPPRSGGGMGDTFSLLTHNPKADQSAKSNKQVKMSYGIVRNWVSRDKSKERRLRR